MAWNVAPSQEELAFLMEAGMIYRDACRYSDAEAVFKGVQALVPSSDMPEIGLGTIAFGQGKFDQAIAHYNNAVQLNEKSALAHAHLGEAYMFRREPAEARRHLARAIELDPRREAAKLAKSLLEMLDKSTDGRKK